MCELLRFCDFLLSCRVLSCPVQSWFYFLNRDRAQLEPLDGF